MAAPPRAALMLLALLAAMLSAATAQGRYCHNSCYNAASCEGALDVKKGLLSDSGVSHQVEATACDKLGCGAVIRYSFATKDDHDKYQAAEKAGPLLARYTAGGLTSASPAGLPKAGPCDTLGSWT